MAISLRVSNKRVYVWDVDDIARIRADHKLCGILTGTLPHLSQQNVFLGVPLVLMPEEVVLLVETGAAVLIDDPKAHAHPTADELHRWNLAQEESKHQQLAALEVKTAKESATPGRAMSEEATQKRREREERKRALAAAKHVEDGTSSPFLSTSIVSPSPSVGPAIPAPSLSHTIIIPAASSGLEWYAPTPHSYTTLAAAKEAGIWDYPSTLHERARCGVFRGLSSQGYFLGLGIRFGGEYLVYPGDPLRYHSHFVATVLDSPTVALRPMEIIAHGRLGTATKKAHLLCGWDDEKQEASYLSIEWAGFG